MTEQELAAKVVKRLTSDGWDVHQEVKTRLGPVHDLVAVNGPLVWVVECKLSRSLALLDQVLPLIGRQHYLSVAVPRGTPRGSFKRMLEDWGVGMMSVSPYSTMGGVDEALAPRLCRSAHRFRTIWDKTLLEEHRNGQYASAGAAGGGHFTPYKRTCRALLEVVMKNPGLTLKEALKESGHHYRGGESSAISCMARNLKEGLVPGLELRDLVIDGKRKLCVFRKEG